MYSIGKLAEISNVTVRTLRYYDEIGLLKPSMISEGGRRYYDTSEIERLQNILFLKDLGFDLNDIQKIINDQIKSSKELLQLRLEILHDEQSRLKQQEQKIRSILEVMNLDGENDWNTIFESTSFINKYDQKQMMERWQKYFTQEEINILEQLSKDESNGALNEKWAELLQEIRENIQADSSSEIAQEIAKKWLNLVHIMYKGNWRLAQKVWEINYEKNENIGAYELESEIIQFIREAQSYFFRENMDSIKQVFDYE